MGNDVSRIEIEKFKITSEEKIKIEQSKLASTEKVKLQDIQSNLDLKSKSIQGNYELKMKELEIKREEMFEHYKVVSAFVKKENSTFEQIIKVAAAKPDCTKDFGDSKPLRIENVEKHNSSNEKSSTSKNFEQANKNTESEIIVDEVENEKTPT